MFRATTYVLTARTTLSRCPLGNFQHAAISLLSPKYKTVDPKERQPCPQPPPPPRPPPRDERLFWGTMAVLFLAGGFAVYAKRQPEVRDWLTIQMPWFDDIIAVIFEENMSHGEFASQCIDNMKKTISDYFKDEAPKQCSTDGTPITVDVKKEKKVQELNKDLKSEEQPKVCEPLPPPVLTKDICEIQSCLKELGDVAVNNYMTARDACAYYNRLVDETMTNFNYKSMKELHAAMAERIDLVKTSLENAVDATQQLSELTRYLDCGVQAPPSHIESTRTLLKEYQDEIKRTQILYQWENDKALVLDTEWALVEQTVDKYVCENKTMFPGVNYESKKLSLHDGDPDLLLYHTNRYAQQLKEEFREAIVGMTERVNRAVEALPQNENARKARKTAIQNEYAKQKSELDKEFKKRYEDQKAANDKLLKDMLKKQSDRHEEILKIRLVQKEKEVMVKFNKMVAEHVAAEKKKFAALLRDMAQKLGVFEDKLNARLKAERENRRSQELWTAGASLLAATKKGGPYVNVEKELKAIEKASGDGDKLVLSVLKAIPPSVREKGIVPESVLKEKYHVMERTALRVALVEEDGAPLPIYWLSWLQSVLLFMRISGIPQSEFDNPPKEPPEDLDTFDLLQRARFWMERGNIAAALRYVNSLEGASRAAASTWHEAARAHLEARQAAEAVLAHAAALGLQYI